MQKETKKLKLKESDTETKGLQRMKYLRSVVDSIDFGQLCGTSRSIVVQTLQYLQNVHEDVDYVQVQCQRSEDVLLGRDLLRVSPADNHLSVHDQVL